jgi:type II secretory pathway pseudopilin PulG
MKRVVQRSTRRGGARINVVVTLLVLVILAALILPAVQQAREAARRSKCKSYLKQIGLARMNYHDVHRTLPPGVVISQVPVPSGGNHLGWIYQILPYMDSSPLFDEFDTNLDITATGARSNSVLAGERPYFIRCPSDGGPDRDASGSYDGRFEMATANYVGNFGTGYPSLSMHPEDCQGVLGPNSQVRIKDCKDGMSNVILVAERRNPRTCGTFVAADLGAAPSNGGYTFWAGSGNAQSDLMAIVDPMQGGATPAVPLFQILGTTRSGTVNDPTQNTSEGSLGFGAVLWDSAAGTIRINMTIARVNGVNSVVPMSGSNQDKTTVGFSSWHTGGMQAVLGDGTVRFISDGIDPDIYQNLSRRSDGMELGEF